MYTSLLNILSQQLLFLMFLDKTVPWNYGIALCMLEELGILKTNLTDIRKTFFVSNFYKWM